MGGVPGSSCRPNCFCPPRMPHRCFAPTRPCPPTGKSKDANDKDRTEEFLRWSPKRLLMVGKEPPELGGGSFKSCSREVPCGLLYPPLSLTLLVRSPK